MVVEIDKRNNLVVLSLGGNIGNVRQVLLESIELLEERIGKVVLTSSIYQTKAWGVEDQPDFLNQVITLNTNLSPKEVLGNCLAIEIELGRDRINFKRWGERVVDIDLLFYDNVIVKTVDLVIPHSHIQDRNFVLFPLAEIIPDFVHPVKQKTVLELKKTCLDKLELIKLLD